MREKSCAKLFKGPQIQNYSLKCCFLAWRRASENVDSYPKMGQNIFGSVSGACAARGECLFEFFIAKTEESKTILPGLVA